MKYLILSIISFSTLLGTLVYSADNHKEDSHKEEGHKDEHGHTEGEEEGDHEEASTTIGPEKGITEKAEAGFKLAPEAMKTMAIKTTNYSGSAYALPSKSLVQIKDEKTVFRLRDGWFKRVSVQPGQKVLDTISITSRNFRDGDQIVTEGAGFLRITEIFSEEGASHGHSH